MTQARPSLLAVDLGLRTGLALYGRDGRLQRHASRHFGTRGALKRGAASLLAEMSDLDWLVMEGDSRLARAWKRPAEARGIACLMVEPAVWRERLLLPRQRAGDRDLKREAILLAGRVVERSALRSPAPPGHDAAEAILIGLWACLELGWVDSVP